MASRLLVTDHFLQSNAAPAVCVFSGLPTGGNLGAMKLKRAAVDLSEQPVTQAVIPGWKHDRSGVVKIPQAPGQHTRQRLGRLVWWLPLMGLPLAGVLTGIRLMDSEAAGNLPGYLGGAGAVLGLVIGLPIKFRALGRSTELRLLGEKGVVEIRFPNHLRAVFDQYKAAWVTYQAAHATPGA